jgi:hypothetical protein
MSVATQLGLDRPDNPVLTRAALDWDTRIVWDSRLAAVTGGVEGLRQWLRRADPAAADDVLHGLAGLGSPTGADSLLAARVLAWALLPGASALARRLASLTPDIDAIVAAQLWLEIRSFPWPRLRKVAANILANTRVGVLRECGRVLGVSQAWFYKWRHGDASRRRARRKQLTVQIKQLFAAHRDCFGSPRIAADLRAAGWRVSVNTVAQIVAEQGLRARPRRHRRQTTRQTRAGGGHPT